MQNYEESLRHVVRPDKPSQRREAARVGMEDYAALYVARALREYAGYGATTDSEQRVAMAFVEYIERCIRDEEAYYVVLYAHTETARKVLVDALDTCQHERDLHGSVLDDVRGLWKNPGLAEHGRYE